MDPVPPNQDRDGPITPPLPQPSIIYVNPRNFDKLPGASDVARRSPATVGAGLRMADSFPFDQDTRASRSYQH